MYKQCFALLLKQWSASFPSPLAAVEHLLVASTTTQKLDSVKDSPMEDVRETQITLKLWESVRKIVFYLRHQVNNSLKVAHILPQFLYK